MVYGQKSGVSVRRSKSHAHLLVRAAVLGCSPVRRARIRTTGLLVIRGRAGWRGALRRRSAAVASRLALGLISLGASSQGLACGDQDVTTLLPEDAIAEGLSPEPAGDSQVFTVLSRPESVDTVCRWIGVSAPPGAAGGCAGVVDSCRDGLGVALGGATPALPNGDLEPLFGCPLTVTQLDGCIAGVLERGVAAYGDAIGCDKPAPPAVDTLALFASPDCLAVALFCPDLVASLAGDL